MLDAVGSFGLLLLLFPERLPSDSSLGIHGSDFSGSEIGCFEPGDVFEDLQRLPQARITAIMRIKT
jgi:hypothetical protein